MTKAAMKDVRILVSQKNGVTVVDPRETRLDAEVAGDLRAMLLELIERGSRKVILDLGAVEFIDSSGLGALVSALKRMRHLDAAGDIRLAHVQPSVRAVLEIIRLHRVFPVFPSTDDALRSFQAAV
jgi:anti-sigma B factor antagonist